MNLSRFVIGLCAALLLLVTPTVEATSYSYSSYSGNSSNSWGYYYGGLGRYAARLLDLDDRTNYSRFPNYSYSYDDPYGNQIHLSPRQPYYDQDYYSGNRYNSYYGHSSYSSGRNRYYNSYDYYDCYDYYYC